MLMSKDRPHLCGCPGNWSKLREYGGCAERISWTFSSPIWFCIIMATVSGRRIRTPCSGAAVQQRLQERHVVPRRAEGAATAHEELRPLQHLEGRRLQPAVGPAVVEGGNAPLLV